MALVGGQAAVAAGEVHERSRKHMLVEGLPFVLEVIVSAPFRAAAAYVSSTETRNELKYRMIEHGVLGFGSSDRGIRFRPPLNLTPEVATEGLARVRRALLG